MKTTAFVLLASMMLAGTIAAQQGPARPAGAQPPQSGNAEIHGTVLSAETNAPLGSVSIAVYSKEPVALVTGAISRPDGAFRIEGLRPGTYEVRVTSIGFTGHSVELTIGTPNERAALGQILLARAAVEIEGVEVTADRSMITMQPDRNVYRVRDLAPAGGNATDVLRSTPAVEVDIDGKVSLRGNENVAVQINGRPTPMRGTQLGAYLEQLPANLLERIEVVPNPSARYDPDGMAGIINIVMKENVDLGISGGVTMSATSLERYSTSGNLGYQRGGMTLMGTYGYSHEARGMTGLNNRERLDALREPLSGMRQDMEGETYFGGHNLTGSAEYKLTPRDLLFAGITANARGNGEESLSATSEFTGTQGSVLSYDRLRDSDVRSRMVDVNLGFRRTLEPQKHELNSELRFNRSWESDTNQLWRETQESTDAGIPRLEPEVNELDALSYRATAQVDYTRTLQGGTRLETGFKGEARWMDRDLTALRDPLGTGLSVDPSISNTFDFDEQVHAVYGVLSRGIGRFDLQGGLRAEYASRDFQLGGTGSFPYDYTSLFPSAAASFKLDESNTLRASYSRRIRRPGTQELNPFPMFMDVHNVFLGNPELSPEYTDAMELSYQRTGRMGSFQLSPFYRRTTDVIRFILDTDAEIEGRNVTTISFQNLDVASSWGTDVNGSLRLGPRFNGFASFNVYKMVTEGGTESSLTSDAVNWSARVNGSSQIRQGLTAQAMYFYRAPMAFERGRFDSFQMLNVSLRQMVSPKSSVTLRVMDPFNMMKFRAEAEYDNVFQITERQMAIRGVQLSFQHTFGQTPRMREPRRQDQPQEPQSGFPVGQ
jgi:ferric enterobactin receptor